MSYIYTFIIELDVIHDLILVMEPYFATPKIIVTQVIRYFSENNYRKLKLKFAENENMCILYHNFDTGSLSLTYQHVPIKYC